MAIEIVDLPIKMVIFHSYISLPEGNVRYITCKYGKYGTNLNMVNINISRFYGIYIIR